MFSIPLAAPVSVMAAPDAGDAWTAPVNVSATTFNAYTTRIDSQAVLDSAGNIHFTYHGYWDIPINGSHEEIYYINNIGGSWSVPYNVTRNELVDYHSAIAVDSLNRLHVTYSGNNGTDYEIFYTMFDGSTWSTPVNISKKLGGDFTSAIAIDGSNHAHVVFYGLNGSVNSIFYTNNVAGSWSPIEKISGDLTYCYDPNILIAPNGSVYSCYRAEDGSATNDYEVIVSSNAGGSWEIFNVTQDTDNSYYPSFKMDSNQTLHVSYRTFTASGYGIMYTHGAGNTWSTPLNLSVTNGQCEYSCLVLDSNDKVHVVFDQEDNSATSDFEIFYTNNTMGTFGSAVNVTASTTGDYRPNLVIDNGGYTNLFYYNIENTSNYVILYQKSSEAVAPPRPGDLTLVIVVAVVVVIVVVAAAVYLLKIRKPK